MTRRFRRSWLVAPVVVLALAFPTAALADHAWLDYHWARTSASFTLKLGDNVSATWDAYLATSSAQWTTSSALDTAVVPGLNLSKPKNCRPKSGRVEVCAAAFGTNGWLGVEIGRASCRERV